MTLVLDTSVLIDIERKNMSVVKNLEGLSYKFPGNPCITFGSFMEFTYGALRRGKSVSEVLKQLDRYSLLHSTMRSCSLFAELKYGLERRGIAVADFGLLIASVVIANGKILVTNDSDFRKIDALNTILL